MRNTCKVLIVICEGKRNLVGLRCKFSWENNVKVDLKDMCEDVNWINLNQDIVKSLTFANTKLNMRLS
jgi:hypothetical protein